MVLRKKKGRGNVPGFRRLNRDEENMLCVTLEQTLDQEKKCIKYSIITRKM